MSELARQDLLRRERAEGMLAQAHAAAEDVIEQLLQLDRREHAPAVERIDDDLPERAAELDEEPPRQRDAGNLDADPPRHRDVVNRREGVAAGGGLGGAEG